METARTRIRIVAVVAVSAAVMTGGCGSTSPIAPTSASTAAQYPSLVGHYFDGGLNELRLQYRDTGTTIGWRCDTMADVSSQRDGSFSGDVGFNGVGSREPPCSNSFGFIAEIRPDGTITNFRIDGGLGLGGCTSASDASVSGTATDSEIRIDVFSETNNQPLSATVRIVDGPSAGRMTSTASNGSFRIDGVPSGRHTLSVISPPFAESRGWIYTDPDAKGNAIAFYLFSPGHGSGGTFEGSIRATDPPCETVRIFQNHAAKPCQRYGPFPIPVFGNMFIQLNWPLPSPNELDFELWRNGIPATQSGDDINPYDLIRGGINDGSYEVRVVYLGSTSQNYQLRVAFAWN